jgi:hypothetical protein
MTFIFIYAIVGIISSIVLVLDSFFFDLGVNEKWTKIGLWFGTSVWMILTILLLKDLRELRGLKERFMPVVIGCIQILLILGIYVPTLRNITLCINVSAWCATAIIFTSIFIWHKFDDWKREKKLRKEGWRRIREIGH